MKWIAGILVIFLCIVILSSQGHAKNIAGLWALGASTDGAVLRKGLSPSMSGDLGLSSLDFNGGTRFCFFVKLQNNLNPEKVIVPHIGGIFGLDSYSFDGASDTHISFGGFGGVECFINDSFSVTGDITFLKLGLNEETVVSLASPSISVHWYF